MYVKIKNHDPSKRYRINIKSGGVHKTVHVPEGIAMPLTWRHQNNPTPLRSGEAVGTLEVIDGDVHNFSFKLNEADYFYSDDHIVVSS